jgi:ATP-dependent helicase/nuclease subunit B
LNLRDPVADKIVQGKEAPAPKGVQRIVLAAVSDPTPLMIHYLERLSTDIDVEILIHAPEAKAELFDAWGRPETAAWLLEHIELPSEEQIVLCGTPSSQSRHTLELIARHATTFGPHDIAIGVVDEDAKPFLADDLENQGLMDFDPAGYAMESHPVYSLLDRLLALLRDRGFRSFTHLLRHPDILAYLRTEEHTSSRILEETDNFQDNFIPLRFTSLEQNSASAPAYEHAHTKINGLLKKLDKSKSLTEALRELLENCYAHRSLTPHRTPDQDFVSAAEAVNNVLTSFDASCIDALKLDRAEEFRLLLNELKRQRIFPKQDRGAIDLEGWLELPWNDAPLMIVTGMNDERIPDGNLGDIFLPDGILKELNLRNADDRFARDAFLMQSLVQSRAEDGQIYFLFGKTSPAGDPLKPTRLFFQCSDQQMISRAGRLFKEAPNTEMNVAVEPGFLLQPPPPHESWQKQLELERISVTAFRDYLACPFRYLLKRIFYMQTTGTEKTELDARDFGNMVHRVLRKLTDEPDLQRVTAPEKLIPWLHEQAELDARRMYGRDLLLPVQIQVESAKQRLSAFAHWQCQSVLEGWRIMDAEKEYIRDCNGVPLHGYIDRVDFNPTLKKYRVIDFKTSDNHKTPAEAHFGTVREHHQDFMVIPDKTPRVWTDLQLPLYRYLLEEQLEPDTTIELGYYNLPKAVSDASFAPLKLDEDKYQHGVTCAAHIVEAIRKRVFDPVADRVTYDEFDRLFFGKPSEYVDVDAFLKAVQK